MKATLLFIAFACVVCVAFLLQQGGPSQTFSMRDKVTLEEQYPGGAYTVEGGMHVYLRCEEGRHVAYFPNGIRVTYARTCWK